MADPEILKINAGFVLRQKSRRKRTRLPEEVISLLTPEAQEKHLAETDDPMEVDEAVVDDADAALDELIFVFHDEDGNEQGNVVQNEPMDVDVGVGDLVINVNEAGDFNVEGR